MAAAQNDAATNKRGGSVAHRSEASGWIKRASVVDVQLQAFKVCEAKSGRRRFGASLSPHRRAGDSRREAWYKLPKKDYVFKTLHLSHFHSDYYDFS
jgi:hypothetical protein